MLRLRRSALLALALLAAPTLAVAQESTPTPARMDATAEASPGPGGATTAPACPDAEYPAAGALSLTDGVVAWVACSPDQAFRTVIGANADILLIEEGGPNVGTTSRHTIAFDAADGSERWRRSTANTPTPPGPFDGQGVVVLATADEGASALVGVDPETGEEKWRVASSEAPLAHSATVAVVWEVVSLFESSRFRGIDRATGQELWVSDIPLSDQATVFVARSPAAVLGEVIVVPTGATATAIDMRTGATLWQAPQLDHPAAAEGFVIGTRGASGPPPPTFTVAAIDAASGRELWSARGRPSYGDLLAAGDGAVVVLDPDDAALVAYELSSGNERWRVAQTTTFVEPQLIVGTSLIGLWNGEVSVSSTTDGATLWSATQPFHSTLMNSAGSNGDAVFVAINSRPWAD